MKTVSTYPYHLFGQGTNILTVHPTIQMSHEDGLYTFHLILPIGQESFVSKLVLSDEQLESEYESILFKLKPLTLKVPYIQDLRSVSNCFEKMFAELGLRSSYKRSNMRHIFESGQASTIYTYLTNDQGRIVIESLIFAPDGKNPLPLGKDFMLVMGSLAYGGVFKTAHRTLHRPDHMLRVYVQSGYLHDISGVPSSINDVQPADVDADAVIEFLDNHSRFTLEPDISTFTNFVAPRIKMTDIEL